MTVYLLSGKCYSTEKQHVAKSELEAEKIFIVSNLFFFFSHHQNIESSALTRALGVFHFLVVRAAALVSAHVAAGLHGVIAARLASPFARRIKALLVRARVLAGVSQPVHRRRLGRFLNERPTRMGAEIEDGTVVQNIVSLQEVQKVFI